jgi:hypothetical protein
MKWSSVLAFGVFLSLSAAILGGAWYTADWLSRTCSVSAPLSIDVQDAQPRATKNRRESANDGEYDASGNNTDPEVVISVIHEAKAEEQKPNPGETGPDTNREPNDWWTRFKCEVKATDVSIAAFTAMLVLVGSFQAYYLFGTVRATNIAADAAKLNADALTQSERSHLFIRVLHQNISEALNSDAIEPTAITIKFLFKNHGKTPAILKTISRDIAYWAQPPAFRESGLTGYIPVQGLPTEQDRIVDSGGETGELKCQATNMTADQRRSIIRAQSYVWFYGRAIYDDIFGIEHEHRFIYRRDSHGEFRAFQHPEYSKNT